MGKEIRKYRNSIYVDFGTFNDIYNIIKVPHYKIWIKFLSFLRKRGFKITENPSYKENYSCLSKYHKIGHKGEVSVLLEITGKGFNIEFGSIKNLWTGHAQSFWSDPTDDRYTQLSYLEDIAVKLEIQKSVQFFDKYELEMVCRDIKLSPEQEIINNLKRNTHIHGDVYSLIDIKNSIENGRGKHNQGGNSKDKNNNQIICGERKYFYDYNRRLCTGIVWHNINNMWWVIYGNTLRNVACFELFDYDNHPRKIPVSKSKVESILKKYESDKDYLRCHKINISHKHLLSA